MDNGQNCLCSYPVVRVPPNKKNSVQALSQRGRRFYIDNPLVGVNSDCRTRCSVTRFPNSSRPYVDTATWVKVAVMLYCTSYETFPAMKNERISADPAGNENPVTYSGASVKVEIGTPNTSMTTVALAGPRFRELTTILLAAVPVALVFVIKPVV